MGETGQTPGDENGDNLRVIWRISAFLPNGPAEKIVMVLGRSPRENNYGPSEQYLN